MFGSSWLGVAIGAALAGTDFLVSACPGFPLPLSRRDDDGLSRPTAQLPPYCLTRHILDRFDIAAYFNIGIEGFERWNRGGKSLSLLMAAYGHKRCDPLGGLVSSSHLEVPLLSFRLPDLCSH